MSYIEKAKERKVMAEKAAAFDKMQQARRDDEIYAMGNQDAYLKVKQELDRIRRPVSLIDEVEQYMRQYPSENTKGLAATLAPSSNNTPYFNQR